MEILKRSYRRWRSDRVSRLAAALSFYSLFSLIPFFLMFLTLSGLMFGDDVAQQEIFTNLKGVMGDQTAQFVQSTLQNFFHYSHSVTSSIFLILIMFFGLTSVYIEMQSAFHFIWRIRESQRTFFDVYYARSKGFFSLVLFAYLLSLHISLRFYIQDFKNWMLTRYPKIPIMDSLLQDITIFVFIWLLLTIIFRFVSDARVNFRDILTGSAVSTLFLWVSKIFVVKALVNNSVTVFFGGGGSIILFMLWIYFCMLCILFGAEVCYVQAKCFGRPIEAKM